MNITSVSTFVFVCLLLLIWLLPETQEVAEVKPTEGSINRGISFVYIMTSIFPFYVPFCILTLKFLPRLSSDAVLARVATEKRLSLIKAWEESEKSKAENK